MRRNSMGRSIAIAFCASLAVRSAGRFALPGTKTKIEEEFQGRSPTYPQTHKEECHEA